MPCVHKIQIQLAKMGKENRMTRKPKLPEEFVYTQPTVMIAGFGGCGVNTIKFITELDVDPREHHHLSMLAANTDVPQFLSQFYTNDGDVKYMRRLNRWRKEQLQLLQLGKNMQIPADEKGDGAGGDPEVGRQAVESSKDEIMKAFAKAKVPILVGGLGGGTGTAALPQVAEYLKSEKLPLAIAVMPFATEHRDFKAVPALERIQSLGIPTIPLYNQNLFEIDKNMTFKQAWRYMVEKFMVPMLWDIKEMIQKVGQHNNDIKDFRTFLRQGNLVLFGNYEHYDNRSLKPEDVALELITNPLQHWQMIIKKARMLLISYFGDWSLGEYDEINKAILSHVDPSLNGGIKPEIHGGVYETNDKRKWIALLAIAYEEVKVQESAKQASEIPVKLITEAGNAEQKEVPVQQPPREVLARIEYFLEGDTNKFSPRVDLVPPGLADKWNKVKDLIPSQAKPRLEEMNGVMDEIEAYLSEKLAGRRLAYSWHLRPFFPSRNPELAVNDVNQNPEHTKSESVKRPFNGLVIRGRSLWNKVRGNYQDRIQPLHLQSNGEEGREEKL